MRLENMPSIITAPDARPYFGVDVATETLTETDVTTMHVGFIALGKSVQTTEVTNDFSRRLMTQSELTEFIDPAYSEGFVEVDVYQPHDEESKDMPHIYVTHRVMQRDEDGEYLGWERQSIYELDAEGALIRRDRMPPSDEEDALEELEFDEIDKNFPIPEVEGTTMFTPPPNVEGLSLEEIRQAIREWRAVSEAEVAQINANTSAGIARLERAKQARQDSEAMLRELGMNEQRVRLGEFAQLVGLVKRSYGLPE